GRLSQVRNDVLLQERTETRLRGVPICLAVPAPVGQHFIIAQLDEQHAAKAGAFPSNRGEVLLPAPQHTLSFFLTHRAKTKAANYDEHRIPPLVLEACQDCTLKKDGP